VFAVCEPFSASANSQVNQMLNKTVHRPSNLHLTSAAKIKEIAMGNEEMNKRSSGLIISIFALPKFS